MNLLTGIQRNLLTGTVRLLGVLLTICPVVSRAAERPHIVIILADDLGYADVGFQGGRVPTPNIDRIAKEGVRLERFYVCPVCSPTRAALLTGRYPIRFGMMHTVIRPWRAFGIDPNETTLPEMLATAGYQHRGCFGKWHLGHFDEKWHPLNNGFTEFVGHYNGGIDFFTHERDGETDWHHGLVPSDEQGYATDLIAEHTADFITRHADEGPLFCYVPFNAVHTPLQAKPDDIQAVHPNVTGSAQPTVPQLYDGLTFGLDRGVGRILKAIEDAGIVENTFLLFCSDNGGVGAFADNSPLRGEKATVFEGGIRGAAACRWPAGKITGGRTVPTPISHIDLLPTCIELAGAAYAGKPLDGQSVLAAMQGRAAPAAPRLLYNFIAMEPEDEQLCVIEGRWKTVVRGTSLTSDRPDAKRDVMLFDLQTDLREQTNVAAQYPKYVARMLEKLKEFRTLQPQEKAGFYNQPPAGFTPPPRWDIRIASPRKANAVLNSQETVSSPN